MNVYEVDFRFCGPGSKKYHCLIRAVSEDAALAFVGRRMTRAEVLGARWLYATA